MNKWYKTIIVNHKEEEGKLSHWLDDENYKILCEERVEQLNEIEKLHSIIKEVREYIVKNIENTTQKLDIDNMKCYNSALIELQEILEKENK